MTKSRYIRLVSVPQIMQYYCYRILDITPILSDTRATHTTDNKTVATGSISLSLRQDMPFFKSRENLRAGGSNYNNQICNYIEDYRSGTVFDIIGSVGGLFALLQSLHVLLFGRPMLWGLTGEHRVFLNR